MAKAEVEKVKIMLQMLQMKVISIDPMRRNEESCVKSFKINFHS